MKSPWDLSSKRRAAGGGGWLRRTAAPALLLLPYRRDARLPGHRLLSWVRSWAGRWKWPPAPVQARFPSQGKAGRGLQSRFSFASSVSVAADGFAQGLQSAPECQDGMGALLLLALMELIRSILAYLKVFWAPKRWKSICSSWFWPRVPVQTRPNLPLAQITGGIRIYSIFQRGVVQHLNYCWPLKIQQRLPQDASAAPSGWRDLSAERSEGEQVLAYQLITTVPRP